MGRKHASASEKATAIQAYRKSGNSLSQFCNSRDCLQLLAHSHGELPNRANLVRHLVYLTPLSRIMWTS